MSLFIVFEGGEGSGKSTQAKTLHKRLQNEGIPATLTHEPGGTALGEKICRLLKSDNAGKKSATTELLLFNSSRAQLVEDLIRPSLKRGEVVVCDRYIYSTIAYQGYGRRLSLEVISKINQVATGDLSPDLVILLDITPERGLQRLGRGEKDSFEQESLAFHRRVRQGYFKMAMADPDRWLVVDATRPRRQVADIIWKRAQKLLDLPV